MSQRLQAEIEFLRDEYPDIQHGQDFGWVLLPSFPLPPGWSRDRARLLIIIPAGYPQVPPDNFYVETGLRTANGDSPANYTDCVQQIGESWGQFSYHADAATWTPRADPRQPDNLTRYVTMTRKRLSEVP